MSDAHPSATATVSTDAAPTAADAESGANPRRVARVIEPIAVIITGVFNLLPDSVIPQGVFIAIALGAWLTYAVVRAVRDKGVLSRWGFGTRNLKRAMLVTSAVGLGGYAILAVAGLALHGELLMSVHMLPLLALYPIWGVVQHWLVQALFVGNVMGLSQNQTPVSFKSARTWIVIAIAAVLFGLTHVPDWPIMAGTFAMGWLFTPIYLRYRSLWPLGLWHGWLAVPAYFWMLQFDPWKDVLFAAQ